MQDEKKEKYETQKHTGFEYLGPQSEQGQEAAKRIHELNPDKMRHIEKLANFKFTWPKLEPIDDEWAGKDYTPPGSNA
jgi:hypothetical protein